VTRPTTTAYNRVREIAIPNGWPDDVEAPVAAMPCIPNGPLECDVPSRYGYLVSFARQMTGQSSGREASLQLLRAMALIERVRLDGALRGRHDLDDEELRRLEIVASNLPWQVWGVSDPCRARPVAY
jgi:hypothetical protein